MNLKQFIITINFFLWSMLNLCYANFANPKEIFPVTRNEKIPSSFWLDNKKPYPTNAWFINLVLDQKDNRESEPVNVFPYSIRLSKEGISLSYTGPTYYAEPEYPAFISALFYQFEKQLTFGAAETMRRYGVASYHGLGIRLEWQNEQQQKVTAPILQGSPYLTEFFVNATPKLSTSFKILTINQQNKPGPLAESKRYELVLALNDHEKQTWLLYSENSLHFNWIINPQGFHLIADKPYTGWIRLALQQDSKQHLNNNAALLDSYSQTIPLDYQQNYSLTGQQMTYTFRWKTQNNQAPLMLSLAHQYQQSTTPNTIHYSGIKGLMQGQTIPQWIIKLPEVPILFLEPKNPSLTQTTQLKAALATDAQLLLQSPFPDDGPYQVGKRYAQAARLILIAEQVQSFSLQKKMLSYLETNLSQKMLGKGKWRFEYDNTWGGIIPSIDDYGARHYNDHHFHYGYWVYTLAVIAKYDPVWLTKPLASQSFSPKQWIEALIRDYANPSSDDPYFPLQRYQDDYAGHSWASGLTSFVDGQNEQSSSEAVNAYYALALYAKVIKDNDLFVFAKFLMTRELVSAQTYWQIQRNSAIYNEQFKKQNQVVANLWDNKVDTNAFFKECKEEYRCGLEYAFGIEMLPFTAITEELLNKTWLNEIYPTIKKIIANSISSAWKWILIKGIAAIMDKSEKEFFFNEVILSNPLTYDHGDSKTNTLYFLL